MSNDLNSFHLNERISHIVIFIGESPEEINLEMFASIVKTVMLIYAILDFFRFIHNLTMLDSIYGLHKDTIEKMVNPYRL